MDQKCFLWQHVRCINSVKIHPERITRNVRKIANGLNYDRSEVPMLRKRF